MIGLGILWIILLVCWKQSAIKSYKLDLTLTAHETRESCMGMRVLVGVLVGILLLANFIMFASKVNLTNEIAGNQSYMQIDKQRIADLLPQLQVVLSKYPEYEKTILSRFGNGSFINIPPELKSDKTFMALAHTIQVMNDRCYSRKYAIVGAKRAMLTMETVGRIVYVYL